MPATMKLMKKGNREIRLKPENILSGHVNDVRGNPTGRVIPGRTIEVSGEYGEKLVRRYPADFINLSVDAVNTPEPVSPRAKGTTGAVPSKPLISDSKKKSPAAPDSAKDASPQKTDTSTSEVDRASSAEEKKTGFASGDM